MDRNEAIEIPFGAKDSELKGWEYTIPEGYVARIEGNKIILEPKESEDERIRKSLVAYFVKFKQDDMWNADFSFGNIVHWFEKQGSQNLANSAKTCKDEPKVIIPKFRVGDIIRLKNSYAESKITEISDGYYRGKGWRLDIVAADESDDYELVKQNLAWSEEDDINLKKAIWYVENPAPMVVKDSMLVEWLKSLKERYTWKPSNEQMEYLAKAITTLGNEGDNKTSAILCELRTDLKKLKG